jgi:hypothetical protein
MAREREIARVMDDYGKELDLGTHSYRKGTETDICTSG